MGLDYRKGLDAIFDAIILMTKISQNVEFPPQGKTKEVVRGYLQTKKNCYASLFQLKSVGPKLVPFFKTVAIYFVVFLPHDVPSFLAMLLKCLPIISLMIFVLLHGMNLTDQ